MVQEYGEQVGKQPEMKVGIPVKTPQKERLR